MMYTVISILNIYRLIPHLLLYLTKKDAINKDMARCKEHHIHPCTGLLGLLYLLSFDKSFRAIFYYRLGRISYLFKFLAPSYSTLLINSHIKIGHGALLVHAFSTIINPQSIGNNFRITHNCTIGFSKNGKPIIGDNVTMHAGSIVIGNIKIGNNVIIGAGAVVAKDIPDNCTVIGNPCQIKIRKETF